jgi:pimeloyl-ACP methyl ester carboxylesterase
MYNLAARLNGQGTLGAARGFTNYQIKDAAAFVQFEYLKHPSEPVVLIGHSWGGGAVLQVAALLNALHVPVHQLITFDAVARWTIATHGQNLSVPSNVRTAVNLFQTNGPLGNNMLVPVDPFHTVVQNIFIPSTHTLIDDLLWPALSHALLQTYANEPPPSEPSALGPRIFENGSELSDPSYRFSVIIDGVQYN